MRRREFIAVIAGTAVIWPVVRHAQQGDRLHSLGVLSFFAQDDPQGKIYDVAFRKRLNALGWAEGRNLEIQPRWAARDLDRVKVFAKRRSAPRCCSELLLPPPPLCSTKHVRYRSCSRPCLIRSVAVSSRVCPTQAVTSLATVYRSISSQQMAGSHHRSPA